MTPAKPTAVGVHAYAGGFTLGISRRFRPLAHVENDPPYAATTAKANLRLPVLPLAADPAAAASALGRLGLAGPDLVYGNPPCAPWSPQGHRLGTAGRWERDPRLADAVGLVGLALILRPDHVAWESVPSSWAQGRAFVKAQLRRLADAGYSCYAVKHDVALLGHPTRRVRAFYVATRVGLDLAPPGAPTPLGYFRGRMLSAKASAQEGDRALRRITDSVMAVLPDLPPGGRTLAAWNEAHPDGAAGKPSVVCRRLDWDHPAPAITGTYGYVHPDEDRCLTVEEAQVICGFPESWTFHCTARSAALELARGVMPPAAAWLADGLACGANAGPHGRAGIQVLDATRPHEIREELEPW